MFARALIVTSWEVERVVPRLMPGSAWSPQYALVSLIWAGSPENLVTVCCRYTQSWFFVFYYDLRPFVQAEARHFPSIPG